MRRSLVFALAAVIMVAAAAPAFAVTAEFKGAYRVRGFYDSARSLNDAAANSHAWMNMRLRLQTTFKISDDMEIITRFDALDNKRWAADDDTKGNIGFERAYMKYKSPYGLFEIGRMAGRQFGTKFEDTEIDADRIKYSIKYGDFAFLAVFEKIAEVDSNTFPAPDYSDSDAATYYLAGIYKTEPLEAGLLLGYTNDKTSSDATAAVKNPYDSNFWTIDPYFIYKFDSFTFQGEAMFRTGNAKEYDRRQFGAANAKLKDIDYDAWAYNLEGTYVYGPMNFQIGYAWLQGQGSNANDTSVKTLGILGEDWDKLWILTCEENSDLFKGLGGPGNLNRSAVGKNGAKIFYVGAGYKPLDNLSLDFVYGNAKAEAPVNSTWSKDYGSEYDLYVNYAINKNLKYTFIAAYLDSGDFWQFGDSTKKLENNYSLFNQLIMSF